MSKYFVKCCNAPERIEDISQDMSNFNGFVKLTSIQENFYKNNPNASLSEIKNCALNIINNNISESVEDLKNRALKEISDYSLETLGKFVSLYQLANAQISLLLSENKIYDDTKSNEYITTYCRIGLLCRNKFYEVKSQIESADTADSINLIINNAKSYYDNIE